MLPPGSSPGPARGRSLPHPLPFSPWHWTAAAPPLHKTARASVVVSDGWVRATEGTTDTSMTAAFMNIDNATGRAVVLVGAESPVAPMVQLHEMVMQDGSMVMQQMEGGLTIEANRGKSLAPGGNHVMLMGLGESWLPATR